MARRKIPLTIYLEPEYHKHLEALATQWQKSVSMTGKDLIVQALAKERRPLTVNERLDRLEEEVAKIKAFLKMENGEDQDSKPKTKVNAKAKS
ncbi:MAG TPA: hypothetical protein VIK92_08875 [Thermaerobacter sp.]|nr:MAG: hypothetical protein DIU69_09815 [Bacillota bacterium]